MCVKKDNKRCAVPRIVTGRGGSTQWMGRGGNHLGCPHTNISPLSCSLHFALQRYIQQLRLRNEALARFGPSSQLSLSAVRGGDSNNSCRQPHDFQASTMLDGVLPIAHPTGKCPCSTISAMPRRRLRLSPTGHSRHFFVH